MLHTTKTKLQWIRPILLTVGAILLMCSLLLVYTLNILRQNTIETSQNLTRFLQQNTDARLREVQKHALTLELNPVNGKLKRQQNAVTEIEQELYRFGDQMNGYKVANNLIESMFIYYPKANLIVGDIGCYTPESYYTLSNPLTTQGFTEWRNGIEAVANGFSLLESSTGPKLCYILSMVHNGSPSGYIVFCFNTDELMRGTQELTAQSSMQVAFGIMFDNQLFASTDEGTLLQTLLTEGDNNNAILHRRPSEAEGVEYVNAYLLRELQQPFHNALFICVLGVVLCGLFGIIASVYIGRRNSAPLRSLITKLGAQSDDTQDEYQALGLFIDRILQERNLSGEKLQAQQSIIGGLFLNAVLSGEMNNEYAIFNAAKRYDVIFEQPYYLVCVIKVYGKEGDGGSYTHSMLSWVTNCGYDATISFYQGKYVILFNLSEEQQRHGIIILLQEMIDVLLPDQAIAALGRGFDSLVGIVLSYGQAMTTLRQTSAEPGKVRCYSNVMEATAESQMMSIISLDAFTAALQQKRFATALKVWETMLEQYIIGGLSDDVRRIQFAALQNQLLEALYKGRQAGQLETEAFRSRELLSCVNWGQLHIAGRKLLERLQGNGSSDNEDSSIAERAKAIINQDFTDPMLGLYLISDKLHVSNSYLSTTFKSKFGVGLVQYINQLRINEAKSLIQSTDQSIKEIALMVGFSSDISFIRVFKRYEDQTPNSLRKQN